LTTLEKNSKAIIDAAIEAGVKRIIPSEFGNDLSRPPGSEQNIFGAKLSVNAYLKQKEREIEHSIIATGPFFDWGLTVGFLGFDLKGKKATIYNGGTRPIDVTTLSSIGASVVGVLSNPEAFKNADVRVHDFYVSQQQILATAEKITGEKWGVENADAAELERTTSAGLARGEFTVENIYGLIKAYIFGDNSSASWGEDDDSVKVGLVKKNLEEEIRKVLA